MDVQKKKLELLENQDAIGLVPSEGLVWWWYVAGGLVFLIVILLLTVFLRRKKVVDTINVKKEAYLRAAERLNEMSDGEKRQLAVEVSVVLRGYLAESLGEVALYETHEEFVGRHDALGCFGDDLRREVSAFFAELAGIKYGPEKGEGELAVHLAVRGAKLLERMNAA